MTLLGRDAARPARTVVRAGSSAAANRLDEQLVKVAARTTREIVLRRGRDLGVYVGCGYPKSGTVWLCQLMSTYLGLPYPRQYRSPVAMASVVHAHWRYDERLPPSLYIRRDGRDVMTSFYFYQMRELEGATRPARAKDLREAMHRLYGPAFDPGAVRDNLPKFVEWQLQSPRASGGLPWHRHVADWWNRPGVGQVAYEGLLSDPVAELCSAMTSITGTCDETLVELAVDRWSFARTTGRTSGEEDRGSFMRKGVSGDWATHFSREAGEIFDATAGDMLVELGYAASRSWWTSL